MKKILVYMFVVSIIGIPVLVHSADDSLDFSPVTYEGKSVTMDMRISRGGQLYDNWWNTAADTPKPEGDHPLWKRQSSNRRTGYSTYRCKECHGWDYRGRDGAYSRGSHYTGFEGVIRASRDMSVKELGDALKGSTENRHDFTSYLSETDIEDLVLFMKKGIVDLVVFVNSDGSPAGGDIAKGQDFYTRNCMTECHGPDGTAINFGNEEKPEFVGTIASKNPWEFIHKVRAGQPGTRMSSGIINKWSDDDLRDLLSFSRTLPKEKPEVGWLDRLFGRKGVTSVIPQEHRGFGPKLE